MQSLSKQEMAKVAAVAVIILVCLFAIFRVYADSQPHVTQQINLPKGSSEKMQEMKKGGGDSPSDNIDPSKASEKMPEAKSGSGDSPSDNIDPSKFKH